MGVTEGSQLTSDTSRQLANGPSLQSTGKRTSRDLKVGPADAKRQKASAGVCKAALSCMLHCVNTLLPELLDVDSDSVALC